MTTLEAHNIFALVPPEKRPKNAPLVPGATEDLLYAPYMAALASLSGCLDLCTSGSDLENCVVIGIGMLDTGEITKQDWTDEAMRILAELTTWGDSMAAKLRGIAESN